MADLLDRLKSALADRYAIERELGRGGMATVYLAEDLKHKRKVAIKVLHPELAAVLGPDRFLREIQFAASLQHPHILPLLDSGQAGAFLYYVMPFVAGESVRARLSRERELPVGDVVRILREVVDALTYAHAQGLIHRDIKPDNVLLSGRHALVMDFGVAKAISEATGRQQLTTAGVALGTPAYMAPEQAAGDSNLDHRVDIYAVGVMAYELLTGRTPFVSTTAQGMLAAHVTERPQPVTEFRPAVPPDLAEAVMRCLEKKPADRWQSAEELRRQLEAMTTPGGGTTPTSAVTLGGARPFWTRPRVVAAAVAAILLATASAFVFRSRASFAGARAGADAVASRPMLVVLPFENLGAAEDEYFADGLTEEITSKLATLSGLGVIARTSAMQYKKTNKPVKQIGEELGVQYLLEGTVRWEKHPDGTSRVRVSPQLIRVADATHVWAEPYEEPLTGVFKLQTELAQRVAQALSVTLLAPEKEALASRPTENLEAYDAYLRGLTYQQAEGSEGNVRGALLFYQRAVDLDPNFALAWARLSMVHQTLYSSFLDHSDARQRQAREAVSRAQTIAPNLPEVREAIGDMYVRQLNWTRAIEEFATGVRDQPNNADLVFRMGYTQRNAGAWDDAMANFRKAIRLDPRSSRHARILGWAFLFRRQYDSAQRYLERAIALNPDEEAPYFWLANVYLARDGSVEKALVPMGKIQERLGLSEVAFRLTTFVGTDGRWNVSFLYDDGSLFERLSLPPNSTEPGFYYLAKGEHYDRAAQAALATTYYDSARIVLQARVTSQADVALYRSFLGLALAGLRQETEAVREGEKAVELVPVSKSAVSGVILLENLAEIYAKVGRHAEAIDRLSYLLHIPSRLSPRFLAVDPRWKPLRSEPAFQELVRSKNELP
ncbi:MAG: protein kinase [Gemmatimonadetes bacterium]|nr:protein kinase [Gemmatimonadota bacterium]